MTPSAAPLSAQPAEAVVKLRGEPPRVMRLSRKAIGIGAGVSLIIIAAILGYALQTGGKKAPTELYGTEARATADGLEAAPKDYSQIPKLGPPLPGDLGGPILAAQRSGDTVPFPPVGGAPPNTGASRADAAGQRAAQERDAARISRLFLGSEGGGIPAIASTPPDLASLGASAIPTASPSAATESQAPSSQTGKRAFLDRTGDRRTIASDRLTPPLDPNVVQAGSIIPAALITGIRSDLPGQITAQVTQNVYDSPTGRILLIPQGSRLIGEYDSEVSFGQNRVLLAWNRLILPDGRSIMLDRQPGADAAGYAGLQDATNYHWGSLAKAALISAVLGVGAELGSGNNDVLTRALRTGSQDTVNQAGQQIVRRQLNVAPTLTIRPGFQLRVIVTRDLILSPIGSGQ